MACSSLRNTSHPWHYVNYLTMNSRDQTVGLQFDGSHFQLPCSMQAAVSRTQNHQNLIHISANHAVVLVDGPIATREHYAPTYEVSFVMFRAMLAGDKNYLSAHAKQVIGEAMRSPIYSQMGFPPPNIGVNIGAELAVERAMRNTDLMLTVAPIPPPSHCQPQTCQTSRSTGRKRCQEDRDEEHCCCEGIVIKRQG